LFHVVIKHILRSQQRLPTLPVSFVHPLSNAYSSS